VIASILAAIPAFASFPVFLTTILPALLRPSRRRNRNAWAGVGCCAVSFGAGLVIACLVGQWPIAVCYVPVLATATVVLWDRWRRRKPRNQARAAL
jgi:membrane protein implicated in regulation of membrane protease activity